MSESRASVRLEKLVSRCHDTAAVRDESSYRLWWEGRMGEVKGASCIVQAVHDADGAERDQPKRF